MPNKLKCPACNSPLKISYGFTGADWDSEAGEGSGFKYEIHLDCTNDSCCRIFTLGHIKDYGDFSEVKNHKPYLTDRDLLKKQSN